MSRFASTTLATAFTLGVVGLSVPVRAAPVDLPAAKVYAATTDLSGMPVVTPAPAAAIPQPKTILAPTVIPWGPGATDLRSRTGFFGYR
jgi:hypothetical protein